MFLSARESASSGWPGERRSAVVRNTAGGATFVLRACERTMVVRCGDDATAALLQSGFGGLSVSLAAAVGVNGSDYRVTRRSEGAGFLVRTGAGATVMCDNPGGLLFHLDKSFTIALQRQRPDLYFLHSAAVALNGRAVLFAAPAGGGKSTLAFSLLAHGFEYLSDELAPIDIRRPVAYPYPRALCLKSPPPPPLAVPGGTFVAGGRLHVPVNSLRVHYHTEPLPLAAIFFVDRRAAPGVACRRITAAAAVAHLAATGLNSLAHPADGLDAAYALSATVPCYRLDSTSLDAARAAVEEVLDARIGRR